MTTPYAAPASNYYIYIIGRTHSYIVVPTCTFARIVPELCLSLMHQRPDSKLQDKSNFTKLHKFPRFLLNKTGLNECGTPNGPKRGSSPRPVLNGSDGDLAESL
jgi:hypothetical protein